MSDLTISHAQPEPNPLNVDLLTRTICKGASADELALFVQICTKTGLDPFSRQIFAVRRWDRKAGCEVMQPQVSIDGFRLVAQRSGEYAGQTPVQWCGEDGEWRDVWLSSKYPVAARVGVYRRGFSEACFAVALWTEYCPTGKDGRPGGLWPRMPALMIAKCAEALALRKAFPAELSGLYTSEEMEQSESPPPPVSPPRKALPAPAAPTREQRRADTEALLSPKPKADAAPVEIPIDGGTDATEIEPPDCVVLTPRSTKIAKVPNTSWWRVDVDHDEKPFAVNETGIADAIEASIAFNATVRAFFVMAGTKRVITRLEEVGHG